MLNLHSVDRKGYRMASVHIEGLYFRKTDSDLSHLCET